MSLNVSYNQISNGIDATALREVTKQIFQRANTQTTTSALANADLTKFNRVSLGTDLYSGKVDASTARQIAMTNSGLQVNLSDNALNSLKYLNSQASKSVFNVMDGKVGLPEVKEVTEKQPSAKIFSFGKLTKTTDLDSNKEGSNPFYRGELLNVKKEEKEEALNIFA